MAGLFYKDFLSFLHDDLKSMILAALVLFVSSANQTAQGRFLPISMTMPLLFLWVGLDTLARDDKSGWNTYARALPLTAKRIVLEKYLFVFGLFLLGTALSFLFSAIMGVEAAKNDLQILLYAGVPLAVTVVFFPLFYRMNAHVVILAAMLSSLAVVLFTSMLFLKNEALLKELTSSPLLFALKRFLLPGGLLLGAGSYFVSLRVFQSGGKRTRAA